MTASSRTPEEARTAARAGANRWKRFADWDERPLRLDKFAAEDAGQRLFRLHQPDRSQARASASRAGASSSMDGVREQRLRHDRPLHRPPSSRSRRSRRKRWRCRRSNVARMLVDMNVPRDDAGAPCPWHDAGEARRGRGAPVTRSRSPSPIRKMRARKTPGNQAHVTNAKDDPLQLAADAATAVAFGFDEIETTMRVARNAWSNARGLRGRAPRSAAGARCSSAPAKRPRNCRSAWRASPPMPRPCRSTAPRRAFIDGDDTPWSKAFLAAAYASRGIKMRCTSGAGSELLMGFHESQIAALSRGALPLPAARAWACRARRTAASTARRVTLTVPGGVRELMAENLIAVWLDLECASGNDARATEIGDPRRRQDPALSHRRLRPHLLRLRLDPEIRQFVQPLAAQRRGAGGLSRPAARLRGRWRADAGAARHARSNCAARAVDAHRRGARGARPRQADRRHEAQRRRRLRLGRDARAYCRRRRRRSSAKPSRRAAITVIDVIKALADARLHARRPRTC